MIMVRQKVRKSTEAASSADAVALEEDSDEEIDEAMVPWYNDDKEWNNLDHWETIEGQEGFPEGVPCRDLEEYLNSDPQTEEEIEAMAAERLFMITIVKSQEKLSVALTPWMVQKQQKKRSRKEKFVPAAGGDAKPYYRFHTAINLLSRTGEMFFITEKTTDQNLLWGTGNRDYQNMCIFGIPYIMAVSQNVGSYMNDGAIVVEPNYSIRRLKMRVPPAIAWKPKTAESFPFVLHNAKVYLESFVLIKATCNGVYCDRRQKTNEATSCSCYITSHMKNKPSISARLMVRIKLSAAGMESITWTSFRFLQWLVKDGNINKSYEVDNYPLDTKLRKVCQKMLKYTNDKGGFLVVGWAMQGLAADHNNPNEDKVISDHYTIHIARAEPMNETSGFERELEKMRFDIDA